MSAHVIDAGHWTADFQLARALWEVYQEEPGREVHVVCLGDPRQPWDGPVLEVGAELSRYHPNVYGTPAYPVTAANLRDVTESHMDAWATSLLIAVAASWADGLRGEEPGMIKVVTGKPLEAGIRPPDWEKAVAPVDEPRESGNGVWPSAGEGPEDEGWVLYPDVAIIPTVARADPDGGWVPARKSVQRRCRDAIIDGLLRFYFKMGYDHTPFLRRS